MKGNAVDAGVVNSLVGEADAVVHAIGFLGFENILVLN